MEMLSRFCGGNIMMHRYFLIEPCYSNPDTFCNIIVGSGRVRATIQIFIDESMLAEVAWALTASNLSHEHPAPTDTDNTSFGLHISVIPPPTGDERHIVRFRIYQTMLDDGAPFTADIQFRVSAKETAELANDLKAWLGRKEDYRFEWCP
jgi:hypothetical protein